LENNLKKQEIVEEKKKKTDAAQEEMRRRFDGLIDEWRQKTTALYKEKSKLICEKINTIRFKGKNSTNKKEDDK
jgi:hypothetical protein